MYSFWNLRLKLLFNKYTVYNIHESWGLYFIYFKNSLNKDMGYITISKLWRTFYFFSLFCGFRPSMVYWWRLNTDLIYFNSIVSWDVMVRVFGSDIESKPKNSLESSARIHSIDFRYYLNVSKTVFWLRLLRILLGEFYEGYRHLYGWAWYSHGCSLWIKNLGYFWDVEDIHMLSEWEDSIMLNFIFVRCSSRCSVYSRKKYRCRGEKSDYLAADLEAKMFLSSLGYSSDDFINRYF